MHYLKQFNAIYAFLRQNFVYRIASWPELSELGIDSTQFWVNCDLQLLDNVEKKIPIWFVQSFLIVDFRVAE